MTKLWKKNRSIPQKEYIRSLIDKRKIVRPQLKGMGKRFTSGLNDVNCFLLCYPFKES